MTTCTAPRLQVVCGVWRFKDGGGTTVHARIHQHRRRPFIHLDRQAGRQQAAGQADRPKMLPPTAEVTAIDCTCEIQVVAHVWPKAVPNLCMPVCVQPALVAVLHTVLL